MPNAVGKKSPSSIAGSPRLLLKAAIVAILIALIAFSAGCDYSDEKEELLITVESELRDCQRMYPVECMVVNGELFYSSIEEFQYQEGFHYRLRVERHDLYHGQEDPPGDETRYRYRLIDIVSKTPVQR